MFKQTCVLDQIICEVQQPSRDEAILKVFRQTFITMDLQIRKSYKFCYEAKLNFLDWASCATPLKPGRKFSTYLAQSKIHFGEFIQNFHEFLLKP